MATLTISDADKFYTDTQVLHRINLDVEDGEFIVSVCRGSQVHFSSCRFYQHFSCRNIPKADDLFDISIKPTTGNVCHGQSRTT